MDYSEFTKIRKIWRQLSEDEKLGYREGNIFMNKKEKEIKNMIHKFDKYEHLDNLVICTLERKDIDYDIVYHYFKITNGKKIFKTKLNKWSTKVIMCLDDESCFNQTYTDDVIDYDAAYEQALQLNEPLTITKIFDRIKISSTHFDQFIDLMKKLDCDLYGKSMGTNWEKCQQYSIIFENFMNLSYIPDKKLIDDLLINGRVIHLNDAMLNRLGYCNSNFGYIVRSIREKNLKILKNTKIHLDDNMKNIIKKIIFGNSDRYSAVQTKKICESFEIKIDFSCMEIFSDSETKSLAIYYLLRKESIKPDFKCLVKLVSHFCSHKNVKNILNGLISDDEIIDEIRDDQISDEISDDETDDQISDEIDEEEVL